jgi:formiminotetrahydrofolate cyclodeaminase
MTMLTTKTVNDFLNEVASNSPAPGGGSVSALAGSLGAALTSMVCRLTIGKKKYVDVQAEMEELLKNSENLRARLTSAVDEDTEAFNKVMNAFGLPKETDGQRSIRNKAIQDATKEATLVPLKLMELCGEGIGLARAVAEKGNKNSLSDAGVSVILLQAAAQGAALNVRINLPGLEDRAFHDEAYEKVVILSKEIDLVVAEVMTAIVAKL